MADEGTYIKNADIVALAGINAGTTAVSTTVTDVYVKNVEAWINVKTDKDWTTDFGDLNSVMKPLLTMCGASKCAMIVINADPTGFSARERETSLDLLNSIFEDTLKAIIDKDGKANIVDGIS